MRKSPEKSALPLSVHLGSSGGRDGCPVPENRQKSEPFPGALTVAEGHLVPTPRKEVQRALLDGNIARRNHPREASEYCIWDTELPGFGLRVSPNGRCRWFVRLRHRDRHRRITLGRSDDLDAVLARAQARRLLAEVALDGLPRRNIIKTTPEMAAFVAENWRDIARLWKPSTAKRNHDAWRRDLAPVFGAIRVADIVPADILRWRDDCAGAGEARFNRALPVLAALLHYAEQLHLRRKGSNPCRGTPRYRRALCERFLSPVEYRRLGAALREVEARYPAQVAIVRLLLYTGARVGEIRDLRWEWVRPPHLALPDSKTGPKIIWLNRQAIAVLDGVVPCDGCPFVFPDRTATGPLKIDNWWYAFRRRCAMPDLRIHDLRHSFASTAIMDGVPLATIGKLLGHQLPETTARYAHLADDVIGDAARRISGSLAQAIGLRA